MTVDQTSLPFPSLATSPWLQPAACWPASAPGDSGDWHPDRAAVTTTTAASAEADGERQPAPMLSPWPRIFPGL